MTILKIQDNLVIPHQGSSSQVLHPQSRVTHPSALLRDWYLYLFEIFEVYLKELKGVVSAIASLQGHLLVSSGPKISLHKWTDGSTLSLVVSDDKKNIQVRSDCSSGPTSKSTMKSGKLVSNVGNECRPGSKMTSMEDREKLIPRRFKFEEVGAGGSQGKCYLS
ncbi:hypothetical protein ZIOFF_022039 [Zingiber officinale]|uniref:Uncharacterized protein n=1 Tax=Zingiber officinale TaxID=94328 RepID=A0A8J5H2H8_ZINOF|nr:hypothetical protein ZIOFF_022039 [Zingiber officinale]